MNFKTVVTKDGYYLGRYIAPSDCVPFDVYLKAASVLTHSSSNAVVRTLEAAFLSCAVEKIIEVQ